MQRTPTIPLGVHLPRVVAIGLAAGCRFSPPAGGRPSHHDFYEG
jgi:hypothetical protein